MTTTTNQNATGKIDETDAKLALLDATEDLCDTIEFRDFKVKGQEVIAKLMLRGLSKRYGSKLKGAKMLLEFNLKKEDLGDLDKLTKKILIKSKLDAERMITIIPPTNPKVKKRGNKEEKEETDENKK